MGDFNQTKYINDFAKEKYDTIKVLVPKGQKKIIKEHYEKIGYESLNSYINHLIDEDMERGKIQEEGN